MESSNDRHDEASPLSPITGVESNRCEQEEGQQVQLHRDLPANSVMRLASDNPERAQRVAKIKQAVADNSYHVESADLADKLRCHPIKRYRC
jgi:anti-sigma28 factor (negative regulator of flagellin synthesis)